MAIERTKEEIEQVMRDLQENMETYAQNCGRCKECKAKDQKARRLHAMMDAIRWMLGDDNTAIAKANDLRFARSEEDRQEKMHTEKEQGIVIADLFRRSGIGEPKE